jgi:hypothetical protein
VYLAPKRTALNGFACATEAYQYWHGCTLNLFTPMCFIPSNVLFLLVQTLCKAFQRHTVKESFFMLILIFIANLLKSLSLRS